MKSEDMPSVVIEGYSEGDDIGIELLSRRLRRALWLTVRDGRKVVLKGLKEELRSHPEEVAALRKEYLLGLRIEAEGVVRVYGFEEHPQLGPVIVMEYVDGRPLNEYLASLYEKGNNRAGLSERRKVALEEADKINGRYGAITYDWELSERNDRLRLQRGDEHFKLSDKMERELASLGMDRTQCEEAKHILWTHIIFETNRIDGADEMREKFMRTYEDSPSTE